MKVMIGLCGLCHAPVMAGDWPKTVARCRDCGATPEPMKMRERRQDAIKREADARLRAEIAGAMKGKR